MQPHYYQQQYDDDEIITHEDEIDEMEDNEIFNQQPPSSYTPISNGNLTPLIDRQVLITTLLNIIALIACFYCLYTDQRIDGFVSIFVVVFTIFIFLLNIYLWFKCWLKIKEAKQEYLGNLEFSEFVKNVSSQDLITDDSASSGNNRNFFNIPRRNNHKAIFV
uniref:Unkown protein n=1 Tax=Parastrongyloides trichosuri TaxID=131310 RepID=A0A0N4Z5B0_PARTI